MGASPSDIQKCADLHSRTAHSYVHCSVHMFAPRYRMRTLRETNLWGMGGGNLGVGVGHDPQNAGRGDMPHDPL